MPLIHVSPGAVNAAKLEAARKKGTGSFFADILGARLLKRPALSNAVARYRKGLTDADVAAGGAVSKATGLHKVFEEEIKTPVKTVGNFEVSHVEKAKRLTAPLVKAQKFMVPIFAYEGLRRITAGDKKSPDKEAGERMTMTREEQTVMMKAASVIEQLGKDREFLIDQVAALLHEKQAHKIASDMVEKGMIAPEEIEKKAAELSLEPDLGVIKKAVTMAQHGFELGRVEKTASSVEGMSEGEEMDPLTELLVNDIKGR